MLPDVVPLCSNAVLLEVGEVGAPEAEGDVRNQTLKIGKKINGWKSNSESGRCVSPKNVCPK